MIQQVIDDECNDDDDDDDNDNDDNYDDNYDDDDYDYDDCILLKLFRRKIDVWNTIERGSSVHLIFLVRQSSSSYSASLLSLSSSS